MPAEAAITPVWKKQKLFVALFLIAVGGWFFWDGSVGYPRSNERWLAHEDLVKSDHEADWPALAQSRGWTDKLPHRYFQHADIVMQWVCGGLAGTLGVIALVYWLAQKDRVLRTDEEAVYAPGGTRIPFSTITGLGKKKWESKGLATVLYEVDGSKRRFILDDYKFDRDATHQILAEIEGKLLARSEA